MKISRVLYTAKNVNPLPLKGLKVLDLTRVLAGPYCTQILGDLGAEVVKVENPRGGDDTRMWGPPFVEKYHELIGVPNNKGVEDSKESAYYLGVNRNKKSIAIDFRSKEGQEVVKDLVRRSDVLIENYLPGKLGSYNLDYRHLVDSGVVNEKKGLIYCSVSGYGQENKRPGYDVMVEAEFGMMGIQAGRKAGVAVIDLMTGLYSAIGVLGALVGQRLGNGNWDGNSTHLQVSLKDVQVASLANLAMSYLVNCYNDPSLPSKPKSTDIKNSKYSLPDNAHPSIVPYQSFHTSDPSQELMLGCGNNSQFQSFLSLAQAQTPNHPDLQYILKHHDNDFATNALRVKNRNVLVEKLNGILETKSRDDWIAIFNANGSATKFTFAPINGLEEVLDKNQDSLIKFENEVDTMKKLKLVKNPIFATGFNVNDTKTMALPPKLGQHTLEILKELGYTDEKVAKLRNEGVIA